MTAIRRPHMSASLIELEQMWAAGDITTREWLAARKPLDEIAEEAQRALARDRGREAAVILRSADPAKIWHKFDTAQQRAIIASAVERDHDRPSERSRPDRPRQYRMAEVAIPLVAAVLRHESLAHTEHR
jgi:hypothetical protein